jgi:N-carbamoyl-L-amino-acid hydrolase
VTARNDPAGAFPVAGRLETVYAFDSLRVNEQRLWASHAEMGQVGALPAGGCCRLALGLDDVNGRELFMRWCRAAGHTVRTDAAGNIFVRRHGTNDCLPPVSTGSHLDTQPHGGLFDGIYGVLAGLEVFRTLNDAGVQTVAPLETIVWTNEEAVRFLPPSSGAQVFAGLMDVSALHRTLTLDGTTVGDDLRRHGFLGAHRTYLDHPLESMIEAHIEQGPILETEGLTIGIVTGIQGARILVVEVRGEDGHAGTTPMAARRDALAGAAEMVQRLEQIGRAADDAIRLTIGRFDVDPNSSSTIAGTVTFHVDLRHPSEDALTRFQSLIESEVGAVANNRALVARVTTAAAVPPVQFDERLLHLIEQVARGLGYPHRRMLSGAGHDAGVLAGRVPTAMIFVPCEKGISHNESERATPADLAAGANVLLHTLLARAGVARRA